MAMKRKLDLDSDELAVHQKGKQLKLIPFPSPIPHHGDDVPMSDCTDTVMDIDFTGRHTRLSTSESDTSSPSSPSYPNVEIYPFPESVNDQFGHDSSSKPEPEGFTHHRLYTNTSTDNRRYASQACTQIPKLRIACESGPNGQRSMWAMCEECGAVQMVDS